MKHTKYKVNVTPSLIKAGRKGSARQCPVAKAVRALGFYSVVVRPATMAFKVKRNSTQEYFDSPQKVCNFITRFDGGKPVKPFSFFLKCENV